MADFENIAINITAVQLENVASKDIVNVVDETASDDKIPTALAVKNAIGTSGGGAGGGVSYFSGTEIGGLESTDMFGTDIFNANDQLFNAKKGDIFTNTTEQREYLITDATMGAGRMTIFYRLLSQPIDTEYNPESYNAQNGNAVAEAISGIPISKAVKIDRITPMLPTGLYVIVASAITVETEETYIDEENIERPYESIILAENTGDTEASTDGTFYVYIARPWQEANYQGSKFDSYVSVIGAADYVSLGLGYQNIVDFTMHYDGTGDIPTLTVEKNASTVDQAYDPTSPNAQSGTAVAEAVKSITHQKTTLIGGTVEDWSIAELIPESGHKYDLAVEPFVVRTWLTSGYRIIEINEYYTDETSKTISVLMKSQSGEITDRQRVTVDNSLGNITKVEVKLRPETDTEANVLFGDLENIAVTDHKRLDAVEVEVDAVSRYFVYDKLTADFTSKALDSTYVGVGPINLNKPIHKGDKVTFRIDAPNGDENQHYFNWYNGGTKLTGIANQTGFGSRVFEYTHNHEQDITALEFVLVKVIQQNAYTITIYDENSILEKVDELSKSLEDISSGAVQVPDYYKDHLSGAISRARTNQLNAGIDGETFIFISDLHWESNAKNSPALIGAITNELPIENVIFGGDAINGGVYEDKVADMNDIRKRFENVSKRFLSIYGNHDSNWLDGGTGFSNREFYTLLQKQSDYYAVHHNPKWYYYFYMDNPTTKTRMIFLDSGSSNPSYASDEMYWLQGTISNAPSGYNILVFSHIIFVPKSSGSYNDPTTWEMTAFMTDVCEYLDGVTDKNVKAIFGGHLHQDYNASTDGGIPIVLIDSDSYKTSSALGTINEQAFDIVTVNYNTNTIHCTRVGRGADRTIQ